MRDYLSEYYRNGEAVIIEADILKFGRFRFDGKNNLIPPPYAGMIFSPLNFIHPRTEEFLIIPLLFETKTTLLKPVRIEDHPEYVFTESDHFWFPNDLSQFGYQAGCRIQIMGYVDIYQRADGSVDYCLQPNSVMVHR